MSEIKIKKISVADRHIWYETEIKRLGELLKKTEELTERIQMLELQNKEKDEKILMLENQISQFDSIEHMYQNKIDEIHTKILECVVSKLGTLATGRDRPGGPQRCFAPNRDLECVQSKLGTN